VGVESENETMSSLERRIGQAYPVLCPQWEWKKFYNRFSCVTGTDIYKDKDPEMYTPPITGKPEQQRFTIEVALALGGAAQLAAAYCPDFGPTVCSLTDPPPAAAAAELA